MGPKWGAEEMDESLITQRARARRVSAFLVAATPAFPRPADRPQYELFPARVTTPLLLAP